MYAILLKAHVGLAVLALALTLGWAAIVAATTAAPGRSSRLVYIGAMASTGLVGVTGLIAAFAGGFATMAFPWIGLVAVVGHAVAGARSRRSLAGRPRGAGDRRRRAAGGPVARRLRRDDHTLLICGADDEPLVSRRPAGMDRRAACGTQPGFACAIVDDICDVARRQTRDLRIVSEDEAQASS